MPQTALELKTTIRRALDWSLAQQQESGAWCGRLESNCCMEAQWVLTQHILGIKDNPNYSRVIEAILSSQRDDGSWEVYYNAPNGDINTTVECYAALRAAGFAADQPQLTLAREWITAQGGLSSIRVFTQFWLAMIGEWDWRNTPTLPPELIALPTWSPIHLYSFASWARATILPLCILTARRPVAPLPPESRLDELFPNGRDAAVAPIKTPLFSLARLFAWGDRFFSWYVNSPWKPFRATCLRLCREEILRHQDADGAWGGIQPPWIYSILALHTEGYALSHPVLRAALDAFHTHWQFDTPRGTFLQASDSIVWDTQLMMQAMLDCGETLASEPLHRATVWLLDRQITTPGDWCVTVREAASRAGEYGGWAFERANLHYPDIDDTAVAVTILQRLRSTCEDNLLTSRIDLAVKRAIVWLEMMQSRSGGWAAFDRDNTNTLVTKIPFCDFGEVLDPPSVDVTAHVVEAMALCGMSPKHSPSLRLAIKYIEREQEADGSWFGRWGVNHLYGTAAVLPALAAFGRTAANDDRVARAAAWVASRQNTDGGWGESPASYLDDAARGRGNSTASQTAWALMSLIAANRTEDREIISRGVQFLVSHQNTAGTWDEREFTGTGFPGYGVGERRIKQHSTKKSLVTLAQGSEMQRAFMINYHLYRHVFPLAALGRCQHAKAR